MFIEQEYEGIHLGIGGEDDEEGKREREREYIYIG